MPRRWLALGAIALIASGAAGCGGDDSTAAEANAVDVADFSFEPGDLTVPPGSTVTWTNSGEQIHNVKGKGFFSEAMEAGDVYEHRFTESGAYRYLCTLHPTQMSGVVTVER